MFKWLKKYIKRNGQFPGRRLTIGEILALDNPTDMINELDYGLSDKLNRSGFESFSKPEKVLYAVFCLETEINNGGFEQYYFNSSGNYAIDTPAALEEIGAFRTAELVQEANSSFPGGSPPRNWDERIKRAELVSDEISARWDELDNRFYEYVDPLEELQIEYMKLKKNDIKPLE